MNHTPPTDRRADPQHVHGLRSAKYSFGLIGSAFFLVVLSIAITVTSWRGTTEQLVVLIPPALACLHALGARLPWLPRSGMNSGEDADS